MLTFPKAIYEDTATPPVGLTWIAMYELLEAEGEDGAYVEITREYVNAEGIVVKKKYYAEEIELYAFEEMRNLIKYLATAACMADHAQWVKSEDSLPPMHHFWHFNKKGSRDGMEWLRMIKDSK